MIEQSIEDKVLAKISTALSNAGIHDAHFIGQLKASDGVKGLENADDTVIVIAKSSPRSYGTATIPTCQINVQVDALVRADVDYSGLTYLDVTNKLIDVFQHWQRCYDDTHEDFNVDGEFACTGYQLGSGNFTLDSTGKVWQYTHSMTVFGVVLENEETNNEVNANELQS